MKQRESKTVPPQAAGEGGRSRPPMDGVNDAGLPCDGRLTNAEEAMELLKAVGRRSWKSEGDIVTVRSVIYDLTDCSATRMSTTGRRAAPAA